MLLAVIPLATPLLTVTSFTGNVTSITSGLETPEPRRRHFEVPA